MITFCEKWWAFVKNDECKHIRSHFTTNIVLINLVLTKPPDHRLMLVNFHRECIGDAKKAQWDRAIRNNHQAEGRYLMVQWSRAPHWTL